MRRRLIRELAAMAIAAAAALGTGGCAVGAHSPSPNVAKDGYAFVAQALGATLPVYASPGGRFMLSLRNPNVWHDRLVLLATAHTGDWLKVLLPVRPNGTSGWVPASSVELGWDPYRLVVDRTTRRLTLLDAGRPVLRAAVAVGSPTTPTPRGTFYLTSLLRPPDPAGAYGPYAFGLSGYSPVLKSFAGGPGELGLHGTDDPSSIGRSVTHGCIRVGNSVITLLAGRLPLGTPIVVTG